MRNGNHSKESCRGDILSAILFIFYMAKCLKKPIKTKTIGFLPKPKYADDITYAGISKRQVDELETKIPRRLGQYDLTANETKTERYQIPKPPPPTLPKPPMETLIQHKDDKGLWSEQDWLIRPEAKRGGGRMGGSPPPPPYSKLRPLLPPPPGKHNEKSKIVR